MIILFFVESALLSIFGLLLLFTKNESGVLTFLLSQNLFIMAIVCRIEKKLDEKDDDYPSV